MLTGLHRTYTIWEYDGRVMRLCVFDHGEGPGILYAEQRSA
jgi:hypothetical protein